MTIRPRHLCWAHDTSVTDGVLSQAEDRLDFNSLPHLPLSPTKALVQNTTTPEDFASHTSPSASSAALCC